MALRTRENGTSKVRGICIPSLGDAVESSLAGEEGVCVCVVGGGGGEVKLILL